MAYGPSPNTTSAAGQAHLAAVTYRKTGLDRLEKKFCFRRPLMKESLPKQNGRTLQFYRHNNLTAQTTPTSEGTVGTSGTISSRVVQATVSQYTAFISLSDLLVDTSISPEVMNASELLGYQAGLSVDNMTRNVIDAENAGCALSLLGTAFTVADLRNATAQLQAVDVQPMEDGFFAAIIHPFIAFDLVNDPTANGLADIMKYNTPINSSPMVKIEDRAHLTNVATCSIEISTNVYSSSTTYRSYIFGRNGIAAVDLAGRGPSEVYDPTKQKFRINVQNYSGGSVADPENVIAATASYNFVFTSVVLEGPPTIGGSYRMRQIDAVSTIG